LSVEAFKPESVAVILIAFGANLDSPVGSPRETIAAALAELARRSIEPVRRSALFETAPVPPSGQPNYINGVLEVVTALPPDLLLADLLDIERQFGRERGDEKNAPRSLDLDLIAYGTVVQDGPPILPHPRMAERAFVLLPLCEIAPEWVHPVLNLAVPDLLARLKAPDSQAIRVSG
jgi:2-amino-4-hydroxy-6-hydroxymethyldihydropteridine diphosphokinase